MTDREATFTWGAEGETFAWNRIETDYGGSDYLWTVEFQAGGKHYEVLAHRDRIPVAPHGTGTLADLLGGSVRGVHEVDPDTSVPHRDVRSAVVRLEAEPGAFRMVVRDTSLVATLRRERPVTARFRFRPCSSRPGEPPVRCVDEPVPITYP